MRIKIYISLVILFCFYENLHLIIILKWIYACVKHTVAGIEIRSDLAISTLHHILIIFFPLCRSKLPQYTTKQQNTVKVQGDVSLWMNRLYKRTFATGCISSTLRPILWLNSFGDITGHSVHLFSTVSGHCEATLACMYHIICSVASGCCAPAWLLHNLISSFLVWV